MQLHDLLTRSTEHAPDAHLVIDRAGSHSYGDIERRSNQVAHLLLEAGVRRGDRVLLAIENSGTWVSAWFGILKAGAVAVPLAHGLKNDRLAHAVADASPAACIVDEAVVAEVSRLPGSRPVFGERFGGALDGMPGDRPSVRGIDLDLAAIIYTSGSTGAPRGVMLSHLNLRANTESIVGYLGLTAADRMMAVLPFYYVYGLSLLNTHVAAGGSLVLENRFAFPAVVLKAMQQHEVTGLAGVPSTFAFLMHRSPVGSMTFPALRYVTQAGGPMSPARICEWRALLPHVPFYVMYGATEAGARLAYLEPGELDRREGSIGRAIPNVELRVITDEGREAAAGEVGELVARGSNISPGYWNDPAGTSAAFGPLGYRTGDLGYADADGFLYLVGRRADMLKVGAHRVGAKEIEDIVSEHPSVHEVAVIGEPHDLLGEVPVAIVTPRNGQVDVAGVLALCRGRLADYKVPARIIVREELPKSGAGKIDKQLLRRTSGAGTAEVRHL
jgi:long-chain acyl-CoA synthetase